MTLAPVFRSADAVEALSEKGHLDRLADAIAAERAYESRIHTLLRDVLAAEFLQDNTPETDDITFLQEHFFLILFDAVFRALGCPSDRLNLYGQLNLCLKGQVVAGDNLFDNESKLDLPLNLGDGARFTSIMQLLCFDHLIARVFETHDEKLPTDRIAEFRRELLTALARIGTLEGSEERGVETILPVDEMIDKVHRVRGGQLFALAFIAPSVFEPATDREKWQIANRGISALGTAFQIVDDVTDFEFDITRQSHNLLFAQITHHGTSDEKAAFERIRANDKSGIDTVEATFAHAARAVLDIAKSEARRGFADLASLGFWFPPEDADLFIRAIAGDAGETRMEALAAPSTSAS